MIPTLVILLNFAGVSGPSPETAQARYAQANSYLQSMSYGQVSLDASPDGKTDGKVMGALAPDKTYDDVLNRVRIKTVSQQNGLLTVQVTRY